MAVVRLATIASRPRQTWDGTIAAQKFLSCVYRIREKSGFGVGVQHIVEVLCGAETDRIANGSSHAFDLQYRRRAQPSGMVRDRARAREAGFSPTERPKSSTPLN